MRKTLVIVLLLVAVVSFGEDCFLEGLTGAQWVDCHVSMKHMLLCVMAHVVHHVNITAYGEDAEMWWVAGEDLEAMSEWLTAYIKTKPLRGNEQLYSLFVRAWRVQQIDALW